MAFKTLFSVAALAAAVQAATLHSRDAKFGCSAPEPTEEQLAVAKEFAIQEKANRESGLVANKAINVDVWFHSVAGSEGALLSDSTLQAQFDVLAENFAASGVTFNYAGSTKTVNNQWATDNGEMAMKRELRRGDYSTLNVYFQDDLAGNLGYCYFPTSASEGSDSFIRDGCSVLAASVPGGSADGYNLGKTTTHEVGHWFGLYHTFQGGCNGAGDEVSDTPAQSSPSSGCPTGRDSCPNQPGLDPIHNYMDYSVDECYEEFSAGQNDRINSFWSRYRG